MNISEIFARLPEEKKQSLDSVIRGIAYNIDPTREIDFEFVREIDRQIHEDEELCKKIDEMFAPKGTIVNITRGVKQGLNFIDISKWQAGLDLETVFSQNPDLDGVIIKATGGTGYVNPHCDPWVQYCIKNNKPWGFYHFLDDGYGRTSGKAEADWFWKNCKNYFHQGIPFIDWEGDALKYGASYVVDFANRIHELSGMWCGIYCSQSRVNQELFKAYTQCPLWVAQYADYNKVYGFIDNPWSRGSVAPWEHETLRQYTSMGYLNGYSGHLDFSLCYIDEAKWKELAGIEEEQTEEPIDIEPVIEDRIAKVIAMLEKIIALLKG